MSNGGVKTRKAFRQDVCLLSKRCSTTVTLGENVACQTLTVTFSQSSGLTLSNYRDIKWCCSRVSHGKLIRALFFSEKLCQYTDYYRNARTICMLTYQKLYCCWASASCQIPSSSNGLEEHSQPSAFKLNTIHLVLLHRNVMQLHTTCCKASIYGRLIKVGIYWPLKNYCHGCLNKMGIWSRKCSMFCYLGKGNKHRQIGQSPFWNFHTICFFPFAFQRIACFFGQPVFSPRNLPA